MTLLDANTRQKVQTVLQSITKPVEIAVYTAASGLVVPGRDEPGLERETLELMREVAELSPHLSIREGKVSDDDVKELNLTHTPTILFREQGGNRSNIRFLGLPSGYEFSTLMEVLVMLGTGESGLKEPQRVQLAQVNTPVHMQAFVTPGCPYCPRAVITSYRFAFENPNVLAEGVEASEFPILSNKYGIQGVPDTVIHSGEKTARVLGGQPDHIFLQSVLKAVQAST